MMDTLSCTLSRGGFSGEVIFEVEVADGTHKGVASRRYCTTEDRQPLGNLDLRDKNIRGFVVVRVLDTNGEQVLVSMPDGEVRWVLAKQLKSGGLRYVPIGSRPSMGN